MRGAFTRSKLLSDVPHRADTSNTDGEAAAGNTAISDESLLELRETSMGVV